jgi:hypothetical protein
MAEFFTGGFVVNKTGSPFFSIAKDHVHEQNNAIVKVGGVVAGLTENLSALKRWMVDGPEMVRIVQEFEKF